ncbi:MAG TPA: sulfurtransferase [Pirellulales bacterium]|jgi:RluA family pseudouridine synthase
MSDVTNIAAYKFFPLTDLQALRERLRAQCKLWKLRGTILLSPEGINLFVAGGRTEIDSLLQELQAIPGLEGLQPKVSVSRRQPFNRMLVRIKREIIAFGVPGIAPSLQTSPKVTPQELKGWLDEGRPITLLDTRNDYEVKLGTFKNALTLGIDHFRNFPAAAQTLPADLKQRPVVMFCTGGIRCEKAGPYLEGIGFEQVFQLDGGILKYFDDCGSEHYDGECFVFDQRVGLDPNLATTENTLCFHCLSPLSVADQQDPRYVPEQSCPYCFLTDAQQMARTLAERESAIRQATTPLPGSVPHDNDRPLKISAKHDGLSLLDALGVIFRHLAREYWQERFDRRLILNAKGQAVAADHRVRSGEVYLHRTPANIEPAVNPAIRLLHEDAAIVVVNKPAPLPLHPSGRFNRNSLQSILNQVYSPQKLRPVHRLDANTTGLVVFARTRHFASQLQTQFAAGEVEKHYLARIEGRPSEALFDCDAPIGIDTTELGGRAVDEQGLAARTEFRMLEEFGDGTSLVEARPITGRTNQIRVHLQHLGLPIRGEQAYLPNHKLGETQTHSVTDLPLCLHALRISFVHPVTKERVTFESPAPAWAGGQP